VEPCLGENYTISCPIPSVQAAEGATNVPLKSRIRGTQRLDNSKGDAALHCLNFSAQWGAHEVTMEIVVAPTGGDCWPHSSPGARYLWYLG
jgi:hypothetical protein